MWLHRGRRRRRILVVMRLTKVDLTCLIHHVRSIIVKIGFVKHGPLGAIVRLVAHFLREVTAEAIDTRPGEDTEQLSLVVVELLRRFPAESQKFFTQECRHSGERQMRQSRAVVEQGRDAVQSQVGAVAKMDAFQRAWSHYSAEGSLFRFRQRIDAPVRDVPTLDQADSLELWESGQLRDGIVGQIRTAGKVDVSDAVAEPDKLKDASIRDASAMAEVDVVEVFAQLGDCHDGTIGDLTAFGKDKVS